MARYTYPSAAVAPFTLLLTAPAFCPSTDALVGELTDPVLGEDAQPVVYETLADACVGLEEVANEFDEGEGVTAYIVDATGARVASEPAPLPVCEETEIPF